MGATSLAVPAPAKDPAVIETVRSRTGQGDRFLRSGQKPSPDLVTARQAVGPHPSLGDPRVNGSLDGVMEGRAIQDLIYYLPVGRASRWVYRHDSALFRSQVWNLERDFC